MDVLTNILYFLIVLGFVVIFHEWGHYIVAKLCGAKVKVFAVGMGPKVVGFKWGETEYNLCALPIGGYVNIAGMSPEDELTGESWEYLQLPAYRRILIVLAGPIMNFVLAFLLYSLIFTTFGKSYTGTQTIGDVPAGSIGWEMGLREGDKILSLNGHEVESWEDIVRHQTDFQNGDITVTIERTGEILTKSHDVPPYYLQPSITENSEVAEPIAPPADYEGIFVSDVLEGSAAEKYGIKPGTVIHSVDGKQFESRIEWSDYLSQQYVKQDDGTYVPKEIQLTMTTPDGETVTKSLTPKLVYPAEDAEPGHPVSKIGLSYQGEVKPKEWFSQMYTLPVLGVAPKLPPVIGEVQANSPADKAGIAEGSRLVEMNGEPVDNWITIRGRVQDAVVQQEDGTFKAEPVSITWLSPNNEMKSAEVTPTLMKSPIMTPESLKEGKEYYIAQLGFNVQQDKIKMGIIGAMVAGIEETYLALDRTLSVLYRLVTGNISIKVMGGPIAIYKFSEEHGRWGMEMFFTFIAFFSVNLGLINLFPLPPLDGGHVVFYVWEIISRRKVTMEQMENFGKVGFALIIPFMLFMVFNDLMRFDVFTWIGGLFG